MACGIPLATLEEMARGNAVHTDAGVRRLVEALNEHTDIRADIKAVDDFSSPQTLETPWICVMHGTNFELKAREYDAVGAYLTSGGFLFCDEGVGLDRGS